MYQIEKMKRKFVFTIRGKEVEVPDPGHHLTPEEVVKFYIDTYPELTNAFITGPEINEKEKVSIYKTSPQVGKKG